MTRKRRNAIEAGVGIILLLAALYWGVSRFQQLQIVSQVETRNAELRAMLEAIYQYEAEHGPKLPGSALFFLGLKKSENGTVTDTTNNRSNFFISTSTKSISSEWKDIVADGYRLENILSMHTILTYRNGYTDFFSTQFINKIEIGRALASPVRGRESDTPFQYQFPQTVGPGERMNLLYGECFAVSNGLKSTGVLLQWSTYCYNLQTGEMSEAIIFPASEVIRSTEKRSEK